MVPVAASAGRLPSNVEVPVARGCISVLIGSLMSPIPPVVLIAPVAASACQPWTL